MGAIRIKKLDDIDRVGAELGVECRACDRSVVMQHAGVMQWFRFKGWNTALEVAGDHFRCTACGARGANLFPAFPDRPKPPPPPVILSEREAKAEVRRRRG